MKNEKSARVEVEVKVLVFLRTALYDSKVRAERLEPPKY